MSNTTDTRTPISAQPTTEAARKYATAKRTDKGRAITLQRRAIRAVKYRTA